MWWGMRKVSFIKAKAVLCTSTCLYLQLFICIEMTVYCIVVVCTLLLTPPLQERGSILCCNVHVVVCTLLLTPPLQERGGILCCNVHVHVCSCVETSSFLWCLVNEQPE